MNDINGIKGFRRVNEDNLEEMADWCGGVVRPTPADVEPSGHYIQVNEDDLARPGDMILNTVDGFKSVSFEEYEEIMSDQNRYEKVLRIVKQAMAAQDVATYGGNGSAGMAEIAKEATQQILEIM